MTVFPAYKLEFGNGEIWGDANGSVARRKGSANCKRPLAQLEGVKLGAGIMKLYPQAVPICNEREGRLCREESNNDSTLEADHCNEIKYEPRPVTKCRYDESPKQRQSTELNNMTKYSLA